MILDLSTAENSISKITIGGVRTVDHDHPDVHVVDQRGGERRPRRTGADNQTVGFQYALPSNQGLMFWLPWKRLSGSYLRLMSTSRA